MGFAIVSVAAATAVVGYDLIAGNMLQQSATPRTLEGVALTGSAAAGDTKVSFFIDTVKIAEMWNVTTGVPTIDHVMPIDSLYIPPNALLHAYVDDAPATNPIYAGFVLEEVEE